MNNEQYKTREEIDGAFEQALEFLGRAIVTDLGIGGQELVNKHNGSYQVPLPGLNLMREVMYEDLGIKDKPKRVGFTDLYHRFVSEDLQNAVKDYAREIVEERSKGKGN